MAVDFSRLPKEIPVPEKGPKPLAWSLIFITLAVLGIVISLWSWPRDSETRTAWFWVCVVVFPVCLSAVIVLRRFSHFHKRRNEALAFNAAIKGYHTAVFDAASIPLAVLASAYLLDADETGNSFDAIRKRGDSPPTYQSRGSREMIVASHIEPDAAALSFDDQARQRAVLSWVLQSFLARIHQPLAAVPEQVPVVVRLEVESALDRSAVLEAWEELPASARPARLTDQPLCEPSGGIDLVDTILDCRVPAVRDVVTVLISVKLNNAREADPDPGSWEAACMMVFCPAHLAREYQLPVAGWFHRPQAESGAPPDEGALHHALRWGRTDANSVGGVISAGLKGEAASRLRTGLRKAGRTGEAEVSPGFTLDALADMPGPVAPWLASALALEQATLSGSPYIVGTQNNESVLLAVLAPVGHEAQRGIRE
ncbi:MAG: hypothetical protein JO067_14230 [Cupriavidus sp.]|nr:hypothetical protein [Cupriavidus sp.]